jgi:two-component system sensor histidine kinase AlgZ
MIARLGDFLRATLDSPEHHEVALADEISLTETYVEIEKARLGERLRMHWRIGEGVLRARVPYLLLQPLVENAIRHGIAQRSHPGTLTIEVFRDDELLHMRLRNDVAHAGLHPSDAELQRSRSVGLVNVAERLAHLYPTSHRFRAGPSEDGGYEVKLSLPFTVFANSIAEEHG